MMSSEDVQQVGISQLLGTCFDWFIRMLPGRVASTRSSIFTDRNENEWQLKLSNRSIDSKFPKWCDLALIPVKVGGSRTKDVVGFVNLTICSIKNCSADCFNELRISHAEPFDLEISEEHEVSVRIAVEGGVKVHCRIFVAPEGGLRKTPADPMEKFCKTLLDKTSFSDVTITTEENSFKAHKAMLSVRSPVMEAMFLSDFTESKENVLDLSIFSEPVVKGFLEFIYTNKAEIILDYASEWLRISDMYQMDDLKEYVEHHVGQAITINNAVTIFHTAHTYKTQLLKRTVTKFIKENAKSISGNGGPIAELAKLDPELVVKLVQAMNG